MDLSQNACTLSIFDEVHHVAAKVFSKAFFKVPAKFVLGLSATLERKDGCERVLNYFIGHTYSPTNPNYRAAG